MRVSSIQSFILSWLEAALLRVARKVYGGSREGLRYPDHLTLKPDDEMLPGGAVTENKTY
eukprot:470550-Hanusia_phi.AAC.9